MSKACFPGSDFSLTEERTGLEIKRIEEEEQSNSHSQSVSQSVLKGREQFFNQFSVFTERILTGSPRQVPVGKAFVVVDLRLRL